MGVVCLVCFHSCVGGVLFLVMICDYTVYPRVSDKLQLQDCAATAIHGEGEGEVTLAHPAAQLTSLQIAPLYSCQSLIDSH